MAPQRIIEDVNDWITDAWFVLCKMRLDPERADGCVVWFMRCGQHNAKPLKSSSLLLGSDIPLLPLKRSRDFANVVERNQQGQPRNHTIMRDTAPTMP